MIREEYGQMAHQTLPNILLSDASLVTKSCIARFVDDDAFNPSALSNCSTGLSPPLAHGKSTLSPSQANAGCPQPGLFGRFRSISEQTVHRSRKIRAQCERPPVPAAGPVAIDIVFEGSPKPEHQQLEVRVVRGHSLLLPLKITVSKNA